MAALPRWLLLATDIMRLVASRRRGRRIRHPQPTAAVQLAEAERAPLLNTALERYHRTSHRDATHSAGWVGAQAMYQALVLAVTPAVGTPHELWSAVSLLNPTEAGDVPEQGDVGGWVCQSSATSSLLSWQFRCRCCALTAEAGLAL
jgi:hypothetical protein